MRVWIGSLTLCWSLAEAGGAPPMADVHTHFNWDQAEVISAEAAAAKLAEHDIDFTVVSATPSRLALALKNAGGRRVVALFSPYISETSRNDWYLDPRVVEQAEEGLASGRFQGIGEVHFMAGFPPRPDNEVFLGLVGLARHYDVPLLIHVDASSPDYFLALCQRHGDVRMLLAHAGGVYEPRHIEAILEACPNVWVEFSARDPWRYGGLTREGRLLPAWEALVLAYPGRFMTGTDPVWSVTRTQRWDQPDEGWEHYGRLVDYHRRWLAALPPAVAAKVRLDNARAFFRRGGEVAP